MTRRAVDPRELFHQETGGYAESADAHGIPSINSDYVRWTEERQRRTTKMSRYKYESAHEWLFAAMDDGTVTFSDLKALILRSADADDIQEFFQSDMERDGFFDDLDAVSECKECGHPLKEGDETHYPECSQIIQEATYFDGEGATSQ